MADFWFGKRVLITGGTGFIGSWLVKSLIKNGSKVTLLVRDLHPNVFFSLKQNQLFPKNIVIGDLSNYDLVTRIFNEYEIEACFHLAAQAIVGVANQSPLSTFTSNIKGTWNLLEAARNSKTLDRMIVASSDKAYGEPIEVPIPESHPLLASHPYDASKACEEILAKTYYHSYGLPIAISRCSNIYGGGDLNFSRIIPDIIRSILLDKQPIIRSDGKSIREYLYISDVISGYLSLGKNLSQKNVKGEAFNFGASNPISVIELVNKLLRITEKNNLKPKIMNKTSNEIKIQYLSSKKAKNILNWYPKTSLDDGLKQTFEWYRDNLNLWSS